MTVTGILLVEFLTNRQSATNCDFLECHKYLNINYNKMKALVNSAVKIMSHPNLGIHHSVTLYVREGVKRNIDFKT